MHPELRASISAMFCGTAACECPKCIERRRLYREQMDALRKDQREEAEELLAEARRREQIRKRVEIRLAEAGLCTKDPERTRVFIDAVVHDVAAQDRTGEMDLLNVVHVWLVQYRREMFPHYGKV